MILRIKNPRIETWTPEGEGDESKYLTYELVDPINPSMRPIKQSVFENRNPQYVQDWEAWLPEDRGGTWEPDGDETWDLKMVPKSLRFLKNVEFEDYDLGEDCFMVFSSNLGSHVEGEVVTDRNSGRPRKYRKIQVVTQVTYRMKAKLDESGDIMLDKNDNPIQELVLDEHGQPIVTGYLKGWSPEEVGASMANMYHPMSTLNDWIDEHQDGNEDLLGENYNEEDDNTEEVVDVEEETDDNDNRPAPRNHVNNARRNR